jgi:predicted nucleotidyltransferase
LRINTAFWPSEFVVPRPAGSDVDVVVRIAKPDLFMLVGIKDDLEQRLGRPVDLVTYREQMNRFLRKRIDSEAVYA